MKLKNYKTIQEQPFINISLVCTVVNDNCKTKHYLVYFFITPPIRNEKSTQNGLLGQNKTIRCKLVPIFNADAQRSPKEIYRRTKGQVRAGTHGVEEECFSFAATSFVMSHMLTT